MDTLCTPSKGGSELLSLGHPVIIKAEENVPSLLMMMILLNMKFVGLFIFLSTGPLNTGA